MSILRFVESSMTTSLVSNIVFWICVYIFVNPYDDMPWIINTCSVLLCVHILFAALVTQYNMFLCSTRLIFPCVLSFTLDKMSVKQKMASKLVLQMEMHLQCCMGTLLPAKWIDSHGTDSTADKDLIWCTPLLRGRQSLERMLSSYFE